MASGVYYLPTKPHNLDFYFYFYSIRRDGFFTHTLQQCYWDSNRRPLQVNALFHWIRHRWLNL